LKAIQLRINDNNNYNENNDIVVRNDETKTELLSLLNSSAYEEAQIRRIKAEIQFLMDAFPDINENSTNSGTTTTSTTSGYYVTSCVHGIGGDTNASLWPVQLQSPLLYGQITTSKPDDDVQDSIKISDKSAAVAIQSINSTFPNKPNINPRSAHNNNNNHRNNNNDVKSAWNKINFLVVGRINGLLDIFVLSRSLEARFGFETLEDASVLNSKESVLMTTAHQKVTMMHQKIRLIWFLFHHRLIIHLNIKANLSCFH